MSITDSPTTVTTPSTVVASYWLHTVGAILGLIGAVLVLIAVPGQLAAAQDLLNGRLQGQDTNGVDVTGIAIGTAIGGVVLGTLLTLAFSILTLVFARKMLHGKNWARIALAVFAALQVVGAFTFTVTFGVSTLHFLVVLAALILSFVPASNAWFRAVKATGVSTF